jgi:cytochrome c
MMDIAIPSKVSALADLLRQINQLCTCFGEPAEGRIVPRRNGEFSLRQAGGRETCQSFVACPVQAGHATKDHYPPGRNEENPMNLKTLSALAVVTSLATASSALAQDAAAGKTSFNKCLACHAIGEGAKNKVGPELNGLDGRHSGSAPDYNYSDANKNSGITWNKDQFLEYIKDPKAKIPGTKMAFAGIKNETEANNLWTYVSSFDKDGKQKQ